MDRVRLHGSRLLRNRISSSAYNSAIGNITIKTAAFYVFYIGLVLIEHYQAWAIAAILIPFIYLRRPQYLYICIVVLFIAARGALSLIFEASGFSEYPFDLAWFFREQLTLVVTTICFFVGLHVYNLDFFRARSNYEFAFLIITSISSQFLAIGLPFFSTISSCQAIIYVVIFARVTDPNAGTARRAGLVVVCLILLGIPQSSFTVIAVALLVAFSFAGHLLCVRVNLKAGICISIFLLTFTSLIASSVNLRGVRDNGEGNNGATRELLAEQAIDVFASNPVIGTGFGKGIVPYELIYYRLGWKQYFEGEQGETNPYALSYHNGFLYLLTRFGLLALLTGWGFIRFVPRDGLAITWIFCSVMLLSISANVVIESVRAGPGVAIAIGAALTLGSIERLQVSRPGRQLNRGGFIGL